MPKEKVKGPRPVEIAIAAVLSLIVGFVGAVAFLAFQPLEKVNELPPEEDRAFGRVYFVEGKPGNASHGTWEAKEGAVASGRSGELSLVEEELNRWAGERLSNGGADAEGALYIQPGRPNFRIADDRFFVSVPLTWNIFGARRTFDSLVSGEFAERGGTHVLDYDRVYVGSCPVPNFFGLADRLFDDIVRSYDVPDGLREGWASLETVSIDDDTLKLVIP